MNHIQTLAQATGGWPLPGDDINTDKQRTQALRKVEYWKTQIYQKKMSKNLVMQIKIKGNRKYEVGFVASFQTKDPLIEQCGPLVQRHVSETVQGWHWGRAGVSGEWTQKQLPPFQPEWERGFNSAEAPQTRQQKKCAGDAPRWHHFKSITDNVDIFNYSGAESPIPSADEKLWSLDICAESSGSGTMRLRASLDLTVAAHVRNSKCAKITYGQSEPID